MDEDQCLREGVKVMHPVFGGGVSSYSQLPVWSIKKNNNNQKAMAVVASKVWERTFRSKDCLLSYEVLQFGFSR